MLSVRSPDTAKGINAQTSFDAPDAGITTRGPQSTLRVALPVLAGPRHESLLDNAESPDSSAGFVLLGRNGLLAGFSLAQPGLNLEESSADLYQRLFAVSHGQHLYRIWNYVPQINAYDHDLENYRHFCRGRSLAFERQFGLGFKQLLPAASAVGAAAGPLALSFLAGTVAPRHFENPRQVPAFDYPPEYGPRSPSFARATAINREAVQQIFISGTAAIIGHKTFATGDLDLQLDCTLENLRLIGNRAGAGDALGAGLGWTRSFKIYLRHPLDLTRITSRLDRDLLQPGDTTQYLQADICRADLLIEIEAVLTKASD